MELYGLVLEMKQIERRLTLYEENTGFSARIFTTF